jgi:nucleotide-binding universal stress UspA family protein
MNEPGFSRKGKRKESAMRIMMYYDGTEHAREALPVVMGHAKSFQAQVDVVSSLPRGDEARLREIEQREDELAYIKGVLENQDIPCETHLLIKGNDAGDDIVDYATRHKVNEIIIGSGRESFLKKLTTGWLAQHVISNVMCPVVLV